MISFVDSEIEIKTNKISDIGAIRDDGAEFHMNNGGLFSEFISNSKYIVGHNIVNHDFKYIGSYFPAKAKLIDTLFMSPILFPMKPYHALIKDDKILNSDFNNPLSDSIKCRDLFYEEVNAFKKLDKSLQNIFGSLLSKKPEFEGFLDYVGFRKPLIYILRNEIKNRFKGQICDNADIQKYINSNPVELAYALALISIIDLPNGRESLTPPWVLHTYPIVEEIVSNFRGTTCSSCDFCKKKFDSRVRLKEIFGYDDFRKFNNENLQERAVNAAIKKESLLAIFPTGGGKSLTFQLPAFISADTEKGLTVIISPLQSLMKDQVDNIERKGISNAVTINGLLSPVERADAIERIENGRADILYIAPESLRSKTIESLISKRNVVRFVIDEAHCFSAWGQDFRVDYLYIGDFIRKIQEIKGKPFIPVSCFTATAKQKVISDIKDYFWEKLGLDLEIYATSVERKNLHYKVLPRNSKEEKYQTLRDLIDEKKCSTIVFVSSVSETETIAQKLVKDGYKALPFNGPMERNEKVKNQDAFMKDDCQIIVATSAFGMGVDKDNVKLVVHYEISSSLEDYIQEAGRAGRDEKLEADCYILFTEEDLDKHFLMLNRSKLSINEIQQVWKAIKNLSKNRTSITCSALELARAAGWDDNIKDIETKVKTAVSALENAGFVKRGLNSPRVFADSIISNSVVEAKSKAIESGLFEEGEMMTVTRILVSLIAKRSISTAGNAEAESRVDYLADTLGIDKFIIIDIITRMRQAGILSDSKDMSATIYKNDNFTKRNSTLMKFETLERFMLSNIEFEKQRINLKELNELIVEEGIKGITIKHIKTILLFWTIRGYIEKNMSMSNDTFDFVPSMKKDDVLKKVEHRLDISNFVAEYLLGKSKSGKDADTIEFSIVELVEAYNNRESLLAEIEKADVSDIEEALLYLSKIDVLDLQGGFLILYSGMQIERVIDFKANYKKADYQYLADYYKLKTQMIHIVGEYASMMVNSYNDALMFVNDYFSLQYDAFIKKYFKGDKNGQIQRNITKSKYEKLFGNLSETQKKIIDDDNSKYISVIAGPGSGKTRVLVHKLASLLLLEDIKSEQLLMLTFSRGAATEFKERLVKLIGDAAYYVDIKTFHSYAFDVLGMIGKEEKFDSVIESATNAIVNSDVEPEKITKTVLVIDEAQDMDSSNYELVKALMERNENMRVIAVGDDDQNIYEFRGSSSKHLEEFTLLPQTKRYELLENYRSISKIINFTNRFERTISSRIKTNQIIPVRLDDGVLEVVKHTTPNMEEAIANDILKNDKKGVKIACLTLSNDDCYKILGALSKNGLSAKLIQSNNDFNLVNLVEIRFILNMFDSFETPLIDDENWDNAIKALKEEYQRSETLPLILRMLSTFSKQYKKKYRSDLYEFIQESELSDFSFDGSERIVVSTIHKAKGREFDRVYLMLKGYTFGSDEEKRKLYVGMTRAKNELHIHTNAKLFDSYRSINGAIIREDNNEYSESRNLVVELSHKDIHLGFFENRETLCKKCVPGDNLTLQDNFLLWNNKKLIMFSKSFQEKLKALNERGYIFEYGKIRFTLYWFNQDDEKEVLIVLPNLYLKLTDSQHIENLNDESESKEDDKETIQFENQSIKNETIETTEIKEEKKANIQTNISINTLIKGIQSKLNEEVEYKSVAYAIYGLLRKTGLLIRKDDEWIITEKGSQEGISCINNSRFVTRELYDRLLNYFLNNQDQLNFKKDEKTEPKEEKSLHEKAETKENFIEGESLNVIVNKVISALKTNETTKEIKEKIINVLEKSSLYVKGPNGKYVITSRGEEFGLFEVDSERGGIKTKKLFFKNDISKTIVDYMEKEKNAKKNDGSNSKTQNNPSNGPKAWNQDEIVLLRSEVRKNLTISEISRSHKRTYSEVLRKINELGLNKNE